MTISPWTIYWITRLDGLHVFLASVLVIGTACAALGAIFWGMARDSAYGDEEKLSIDRLAKRIMRVMIPTLLISGLMAMFVPTSREVAAMIVLPRIVNNEDVQALGADFPRLAREWLEGIRPKADKE